MQAFRCSGCGAWNRLAQAAAGRQPICGRCKLKLDTSGAPQDVSEADLDRAIAASPVPVLVDFWAPWCGPCRMAAPMLDRIARANAGRLTVLKLNTDEHPGPSSRHRIQGIPAFVLFKDGAEADRQVGLPPASSFERWLSQHTRAA